MILKNRRSIKILVISLVFFGAAFFCNVAEANAFTEGISNIFNFINKNIIGQIKKDYCKNYVLYVSNGEWKSGELRTKLGKKVCASIITPISSQASTGNSTVSKIETPNNYSVNNPIPSIYFWRSNTGSVDLDASKIINFTNIARKNNDSALVNLKENSLLKNMAKIRVKDMFANSYFEHNSPTGDNASKEAVKNGYSYITIGENIALGDFDGPDGLVTAWMNSPGHRANILNKNYTEIGVYAERGTYEGQKVWIVAQIFGKPLSGCNEPDTILKDNIYQKETLADDMLANINKIDAELQTLDTRDTKTYNSKVAERNDLTELYNNLNLEIKSLVAKYNKEVAAFNLCIKVI